MSEYGMDEKRQHKRNGKQISVRFGEESTPHVGLTFDVSPHGIFLKSSRIYPHQTNVMISMTIPTGQVIQCEGVVRWAKRVPQALARVMPKNGMGIFITNPPQEYLDFISGFDSTQTVS
jgi:hypothetical protein